uniref:SLIT and NTRK like family member 2 n=1 Tax=Sparus aurata TaxID=8175 RepID=A0A671V5M8_SPAAU
MLSGVLFLSVLSVTSLTPSETQSRKTKEICKSRCSCEERRNILNINCENKGFTTVSKFQAPPNKILQLFLNGNFLSRLSTNEFVNYGNVTSLYLRNNGLQEIRTGAFNGLRFLKQLSLNNNNLEVIKKDTFSGLESLEYLQADYNYISAIEPGALIKLKKLKVLILSDNLLLSLPPNIFLFVISPTWIYVATDSRCCRLLGNLNINCQKRNLHNIRELNPKPSSPKKLHLTGNYLQVIYRTDLTEHSSLELLHLGNNRIAVIQEGAFENLTKLRRLYLNGNYIKSLSQSLFAGLQSLQYLYLEYNIIKDISPQTFNALHNLQLLFLNNNRLRSLPDNVFGGTMLTILNLGNNHFSYLPVRGVLDQLSAFIQIDLQENPWDCTCDIMALKNWMELSSTSVVVNGIPCDSPSEHAGRLLHSLRNEAICPEPSEVPPQPNPTPTKAPTLMGSGTEPTTPSSSSSSSSFSSVSPTESQMHTPELHPEVPPPVLIPCLFVVFTCLASFVVLVFVRKHLWINLRRAAAWPRRSLRRCCIKT